MNPSIIRHIPISGTLKCACEHLRIKGNRVHSRSSQEEILPLGAYRRASTCSQQYQNTDYDQSRYKVLESPATQPQVWPTGDTAASASPGSLWTMESQAPPQNHWVRIWPNVHPRWFPYPLKSEKQAEAHREGKEAFQWRAIKKGFLKEASFEEEKLYSLSACAGLGTTLGNFISAISLSP